MALVKVVKNNPNTRQPRPAGDQITVEYDVTIAVGPNAYPLGGEPVDFSDEFREVYSVIPGAVFDNAAGGAATQGAFLAAFQRATGNTSKFAGVIRLFASGANAQDKLPELAAGAYATALIGTLTVTGRPATDAQ